LIRTGTDSDTAAYIRLIGEAWGEYPGVIFDVDAELPELYRLASWFAEAGGRVWLAKEDGRALGMVGTRPLGADAAFEICKMYVDRAARGSGLAQRLIETAEAHARAMPVRDALGAGLPAAGVSCGFSRDMLEQIGEIRMMESTDGPFAADCLTEDYELG
jgi:GNAT superfamily N-acetyltransferase